MLEIAVEKKFIQNTWEMKFCQRHRQNYLGDIIIEKVKLRCLVNAMKKRL